MTNAVLLVATACWLGFVVRYFARRDGEIGLVAASAVMAAVWLFVAPPAHTNTVAATISGTRRAGSCAAVTQQMSAPEIRTALGDPASVVSEEDTQGPGAEAWVYPSANCVVHVLNGRARSVGFE